MPDKFATTPAEFNLLLVKRLVCVAAIFGMLSSFKLFFPLASYRNFPNAPVSKLLLVDWPEVFVGIFAVFLLLALLLSLLLPGRAKFRWTLVLALFSFLFLLAIDLNCFQPWAYEYAVLLSLVYLSGAGYGAGESGEREERCRVFRFFMAVFLACVYIFSGLEKLNYRFLSEIGPWLFGLQQNLSLAVPESVLPPLGPYAALALFMALGEAACGGLLLFSRTRAVAACLLALMHISLFLILGPTGKNLNYAVWSWNIFSALILLLAFVIGPPAATFKEVLLSVRTAAAGFQPCRFGAGLFLLCGVIVPTLGLFQLADPYPSFALYSGDVPRAVLILDPEQYEGLPREVQSVFYWHDSRPERYLDILDWSVDELGVAAYPSAFYYEQLAGQFLRKFGLKSCRLLLVTYPKGTAQRRFHYRQITP
ncbi:MAG: hypothetical protein HY986_14565 [Candidatus Melainabacteria bacterium]|nr:hypothetical protein [Candidatus Melainabacteria bacterium]